MGRWSVKWSSVKVRRRSRRTEEGLLSAEGTPVPKEPLGLKGLIGFGSGLPTIALPHSHSLTHLRTCTYALALVLRMYLDV